jgi:hypothetical protein
MVAGYNEPIEPSASTNPNICLIGSFAMKKSILSLIAVVLPVFAFLIAPSVSFGQGKGKSGKGPDTYMVVKIIDENKVEERDRVVYKAISTSQYKDEDKRVKDENKQKMEEWHDLLKTDPQTPMPKKIVLRKIPKLVGYLTQKIAQEEADKLKAEEANKDSSGPKKPVKQ